MLRPARPALRSVLDARSSIGLADAFIDEIHSRWSRRSSAFSFCSCRGSCAPPNSINQIILYEQRIEIKTGNRSAGLQH